MIEEHFLGSHCTGPLGSVSYLLGMCEFVCLSKSKYVCASMYLGVYECIWKCGYVYKFICEYVWVNMYV